MLPFDEAMAAGDQDLRYDYNESKAMLYALAVGMGRDPLDEQELAFVAAQQPRTLPTLATVIAWGARDIKTLGVDYPKVLHGEQRLTVHRPIPAAAELTVSTRTLGLYDKGADKGAVIVSQIDIRDAVDSDPICTLQVSHFARGDGGFSEGGADSGDPPKPKLIPDREPDEVFELPTEARQPLFYRLLGDLNPLHSDPVVAARAGFDRPIMHGLCTYGICCHGVVKYLCDYQAERIHRFEVRFAAPVFAGETLSLEAWREGDEITFRVRSLARDVVVINNGYCALRPL